jgi:hypothetical protein
MKAIGSRWILALAAIGFAMTVFALPAQAGEPAGTPDASGSGDTTDAVSAKPEHKRRYVPPITMPIYNETARITTELRPFYMYHVIPSSFVTNGGHINVVAVQARAAITERLGFIATKDGYADINFASTSPVSGDDGFVNITAGFKYAVISNPEEDAFFSLGLRYEAPSGDLDVGPIELQGTGDGFLDFFMTGERTIGDRFGIQGSFGVNLAMDSGNDTSFIHSSIHADADLIKNILFGVLEFNVISTADRADRTDGSVFGSFEGYDLVNFGNSESGTVFTAGFGLRAQLHERVLFGVAFEVPFGGRKDMFDYRWTTDFVFVL